MKIFLFISPLHQTNISSGQSWDSIGSGMTDMCGQCRTSLPLGSKQASIPIQHTTLLACPGTNFPGFAHFLRIWTLTWCFPALLVKAMTDWLRSTFRWVILSRWLQRGDSRHCGNSSLFLIDLWSCCHHHHHQLRGHIYHGWYVDSTSVTGCIVVNIRFTAYELQAASSMIRSSDGRFNTELGSSAIVELPLWIKRGVPTASPMSMTYAPAEEIVSVEHISTTHVFTNPQHVPAEYVTRAQERDRNKLNAIYRWHSSELMLQLLGTP